MEDIANRADVSRGTVFYNFESKEEIVFALRFKSVEESQARALAAMRDGMPALQALEYFMVETCLWTEKNSQLCNILIMYGPPVLRDQVNLLIPLEIIERAQKEGSLSCELELSWLSALFNFVLVHAQMSWIAQQRSASLNQDDSLDTSAASLVKAHLALVLKGVAGNG